MNDFNALINGLHGFSIAIGLVLGLVGGFVFAMLTYRFYGKNFRNTFERLSDEMKKSYDGVTSEMKSSFKSLSSEALANNQSDFLTLADRELDKKSQQHTTELQSKKALIDTQLQQMSETLKAVPAELEKNQSKVTEVLDKSAEQIEKSNKSYLDQLTEKSETQTKQHSKELEGKKELIDQRLTDMDVKLGKVERLVQELQTDRKAQYGALGQQLQSLTTTATSLQKALADNQARGQWGERIAEQILEYLGLREGISYTQQTLTPSGERPDFTFLLPNHLSLNMDCKFPIDNYLKYVEADSDSERQEYSKNFLRNVEKHVTDVTNRDYINPKTVDCVLIFIPNEQIYRFIHEAGTSVIDSALQNKVILCSPLTLYMVLAVIRQASQNFNIEQRSREIFSLVNEIRDEWKKYSEQMAKLERSFKSVNDNFHRLNFTRSRALDRRFDKIEVMLDSNELSRGDAEDLTRLPEQTT